MPIFWLSARYRPVNGIGRQLLYILFKFYLHDPTTNSEKPSGVSIRVYDPTTNSEKPSGVSIRVYDPTTNSEKPSGVSIRVYDPTTHSKKPSGVSIRVYDRPAIAHYPTRTMCTNLCSTIRKLKMRIHISTTLRGGSRTWCVDDRNTDALHSPRSW